MHGCMKSKSKLYVGRSNTSKAVQYYSACYCFEGLYKHLALFSSGTVVVKINYTIHIGRAVNCIEGHKPPAA